MVALWLSHCFTSQNKKVVRNIKGILPEKVQRKDFGYVGAGLSDQFEFLQTQSYSHPHPGRGGKTIVSRGVAKMELQGLDPEEGRHG